MVDIHSILADHRSKIKSDDSNEASGRSQEHRPSSSEIPDVFFDKIIVDYKLNRIEILVLMYIYRRVWSFPAG